MINSETAAAVRDAVQRVLSGRETVPPDLPYPSAINEYVLGAAWPDAEPGRQALAKDGRRLTRAAMQVYIAGYFAGRACDAQVGEQIRRALGIPQAEAASTYHEYVGLAVCLVCDQAPDHPVHEEPGGAVTRRPGAVC